MNRYRIGRIEGRWTNFVPPIQGGKFRLPCANDDLDDAETDALESPLESADASSTSQATSRDPSPVFDKTVGRAGVPEGYAAMDGRSAIKAMVRP